MEVYYLFANIYIKDYRWNANTSQKESVLQFYYIFLKMYFSEYVSFI